MSRIFRGKHQYRHPVPIDGDLPAEISLICEWYSPITANRCKFHFRKTIDRAKYSMQYFIGLVQIDLGSGSSSSSSSHQESYSISLEQRNALDEALKMTTPVKRGSNTTVGMKMRKQARRDDEAKEDKERMQKARMNLGGRAGARAGTRAGGAAGVGGEEEDDGHEEMLR